MKIISIILGDSMSYLTIIEFPLFLVFLRLTWIIFPNIDCTVVLLSEEDLFLGCASKCLITSASAWRTWATKLPHYHHISISLVSVSSNGHNFEQVNSTFGFSQQYNLMGLLGTYWHYCFILAEEHVSHSPLGIIKAHTGQWPNNEEKWKEELVTEIMRQALESSNPFWKWSIWSIVMGLIKLTSNFKELIFWVLSPENTFLHCL
jgi:hypothetical protein